jgi:serine protease Do
MRQLVTLAALLLFCPVLLAQTREQKVRNDRDKVTAEGFWIYNDLPKAFEQAKQTGRPILAVLRCIPCEECVKLDDEIVNQDPIVKPLLEKFVCVRIVSTNGLDLNLFQYDYDQSFAAFLLRADGTIYGRFGTRSHRSEWVGDVSVQGMAEAMKGALELHAKFDEVKSSLAGKKGPQPEFARPELFPSLKTKYTSQIDYQGKVVQSCIHCHQIADAQREYLRKAKTAFPEETLFPYPHPKSQGLILDPKQRATVLKVEPNSTAANAGFQPGDKLLSLADQPLLSIADVQWVLHRTSAKGAEVVAELERGSKKLLFSWKLPEGWRRSDNISWRASSWGMRRMTTGGMLLEAVEEDARPKGLTANQMALRAKHVGEFGPHAAAKKAGLKREDVIVSWDGRGDFLRETDILAYGMTQKKPGDKINVVVLRDGKPLSFILPMQE